MRRATLSLDFLFSISVMLLISATLFGMAYIQIENASAITMQYKAEAIAMAAGSAINHYIATNATGGYLSLDMRDPTIEASDLASGGVPFLGAIDVIGCTMDIDSNVLTVAIEYSRFETNILETSTAKYPLVTVTPAGGPVDCSGTITVTPIGGVTLS